MKKSLLVAALVLTAGVTLASVNAASAFGGEDHQGMRRGGEHRAGTLISPELREEMRAQHQNMSEEERAARHAEHRAMRAEKHEAMEEFTGLSHDELREVRRDGGSIGGVVLENGRTQQDAEVFLQQQANERVDAIVERHNLDDAQEQGVRDRVGEFVQNMLNRWFS